MRRRAAFLVAVAIAVDSPRAAGDPYEPKPGEVLHLKTPSTAKTDGGTDLRLPPGYFFDEDKYDAVDLEMKRLQVAETRLKAENRSLRANAADMSFGWYALGTAVVLGFAAGFYAARQ